MLQKEFDSILDSRQVVPKLNELETLIADASQRRATATDGPDPTPYVLNLRVPKGLSGR